MMKKSISVYQLGLALFLSRIFTFLLNIPVYSGRLPIGSLLVSELLSVVIGAAFVLPSVFLKQSKNPPRLLKKILSVLYIAVFAAFICSAFYDFYRLFSGVVFEGAGIMFLCLTMFTVTIYAAKCGIEGIMRTGTVLFVIFAVSFAFIIISSVKKFDFGEASPGFNGGYMINTFLGSAEYIMFAVLSKKAKGNLKSAGILFILLSAAFSFVAVVLVSGVLGELAKYQAQPFFLLGSISEISILTKFKAVHAAVFALLAAFKLSLLLLCIDTVYKYAFVSDKTQKSFIHTAAFYVIAGVAAVLSVAVCIFGSFYNALSWITGNIAFTAVFSLLLPAAAKFFAKAGGEK